MPEFISEVAYEYPELLKRNIKSAFEVLYNSEFGKIISIISSAMKDRTTNVVFLMNFLFKVNSPIDILTESESNCRILDRYKQINHTYEKLLEKAKRVARSSKRIAFFQYGGELSMSSDIANELSYRFPSKIIIVAYVKGNIANVSVRGSVDVRKITIEAIKQMPGATGGGHENATGAKMPAEYLLKFRNLFEEYFRR